MMFADKYPSIFSPQMKAIAFIILQISFATRAVLKIREYINKSLRLARKYARIFVRGHYLSEKRRVFRELSSWETVSYKVQIMSKDKYASMFSPQWRLWCLLSFKSFAQRVQLYLTIRLRARVFSGNEGE